MFGTAMVGCLLVVSATIALFIIFRFCLEIFPIIILIVLNIMMMSYCTPCHHCSLHYFQVFVENIIILIVLNINSLDLPVDDDC